MADETLNASEEQAPAGEVAAAEPTHEHGTPAPESKQPEPREPERRWGGVLLGLALLAVLLTLVGVSQQMQKHPNHLPLGLGLLLWGILDLSAQARGLVVWRGAKAVVGNIVNLVRGLALLGLGVWLSLMGVGLLRPVDTALLTSLGVFLLAAYLGTALLLEILVKGVRLSAQAFLLGSLAAMVVSYLYFSIPFTYTWAAVFALLSAAAAAWAAYRGVLDETPALSRAVLIAVLIMGLPLGVYTVQQLFLVQEQPLFTPTLLIPRMRTVVADLGADAGQLTWAPVHTKSSQPGDVPYSDKIAFTDWRDDKPGVGLYTQLEDGKGELAWLETGEDVRLAGFSPDGRVLALTQVRQGSQTPSLAVLEAADPAKLQAASLAAKLAVPTPDPKAKAGERHKQAREAAAAKAEAAAVSPYVMRTLYSASVAEAPEHGQIWRSLGRELYFEAPQNGLREGEAAVLRADLKERRITRLREGRGMPAASPDGAWLLSVGFTPGERYLEMADGVEGTRFPRRFRHLDEKRYFPAWNAAQTRVLFIKGQTLMIMNANGTQQRPFDPSDLDSKLWYSDKTLPFTLQWRETGDTYSVFRSKPDGSGEQLIYKTEANFISPPQWSPDSRRVAFVVNQNGEYSILTVGADASWPRRFFATADKVHSLTWSPDSLRLAWFCERESEDLHQLWTADVQGLDPRLEYESKARLSHLSWSPLGKHVAFQSTESWGLLGIRLVHPDINNVLMLELGSRNAKVMTRYGVMARQPAFSPQGVAIAYLADQRPWYPSLLRERTSALVISQLF